MTDLIQYDVTDGIAQITINRAEKRNAMMTEALKIARDDVAIIPLHQQPLAWAVRDGVSIPLTADNKPRLWYAKVE